VKDAFVPLIKFKCHGVDMDLSFAAPLLPKGSSKLHDPNYLLSSINTDDLERDKVSYQSFLGYK